MDTHDDLATSINTHDEDADMAIIRDGCDTGSISAAWHAAYTRRYPLLRRTVLHLGCDATEATVGLLPRRSIRVAASWLLSN